MSSWTSNPGEDGPSPFIEISVCSLAEPCRRMKRCLNWMCFRLVKVFPKIRTFDTVQRVSRLQLLFAQEEPKPMPTINQLVRKRASQMIARASRPPWRVARSARCVSGRKTQTPKSRTPPCAKIATCAFDDGYEVPLTFRVKVTICKEHSVVLVRAAGPRDLPGCDITLYGARWMRWVRRAQQHEISWNGTRPFDTASRSSRRRRQSKPWPEDTEQREGRFC